MVGERLFRDAPALLLLVFMTNYLAIPAAIAGAAVFLPKLILLVIDPLVGYRSDVQPGSRGRRRPFLLVGAALSASAFVLMFNVPPIASMPLRSLYMGALIGGAFMVYSLYSVPYLALASDMTPDAYQRTRLLSFRMGFLAVGLNLSAFAGLFIDLLGGGVRGYRIMAILYGLVCLATMITPALVLREAPRAPSRRDRSPGGWQVAARKVLADTGYRRLLLANFLQKASEGVSYGSFAYFFLYWLQQPLSAISACVLCATAAQIVAQPLWVRISRRQSRSACCTLALTGYLCSNACWLFVPPGVFWPVPVLGFVTGLFAAGMLLMLVAMMSDIAVRAGDTVHGGFEGVVAGIWLATEKIGFAAGAGLVGLTLSLFGFVESSGGTSAVQSHRALIGIAISYLGLGSLLYLTTLALIVWVGRPRATDRSTTGIDGSPQFP
jgi:GPH family glycoside/pentoside/hexuronide:cation symporter